MEPKSGFEPETSSLPRMRSTPELLGLNFRKNEMERETRLELATFSLEG